MNMMAVVKWSAAVVLTAVDEAFQQESGGFDVPSVSLSVILADGHEAEITDGDTPFTSETIEWIATKRNCRCAWPVSVVESGELEGWESEEEENDGSFADAIGDLTDLFLESPSDNIEVSIDLPTVVKARNRGYSALTAARMGWYKVASEYRDKGKWIYRKDRVIVWASGGNCRSVCFKVVNKRDIPADAANVDRYVKAFLALPTSPPINLGAELSDDDDGIDTDCDSEESWFDVPVRGAKGNGFYRYSRNLGDDRQDRFLSLIRWIESTDMPSLARAFRSEGTFYRALREDRTRNLHRNGCVYGPVFRAGSHEMIRYTTAQVEILTALASRRLGWRYRVTGDSDHMVAYYRNHAVKSAILHPEDPTPRECRLAPVTTVTQERSYAGTPWPFTATESAISHSAERGRGNGRWGVSTVRANRRKAIDADKMTAPGKIRAVTAKRTPVVRDTGEGCSHREWSFVDWTR